MNEPKTGYKVHLSRFTCNLYEGAKCHFVPHEKNDYVPHVLKHRVLLGYSAVMVLVKAVLIASYAILPAAAVLSGAITPANVIKLTNVARVSVGLPELKANESLSKAAADKAADMLANQYFAHTSPSGVTPWYWIKNAGYDYRFSAENLAVRYTTDEGVMQGWMASPTHEKNIIDPRFVDIGVGIVQGTYENYDTIFVVQMFGRPQGYQDAPATAPQPVAVEPAPASIPTQPVAAVVPEQTSTAPVVAGVVEQDAPAPQPVAAKIVPVIEESTVKVLPTDGGYDVHVAIEGATNATVYKGAEAVALKQTQDGTWEGAVPAPMTSEASPSPAGSEHVFVAATSADGRSVVQSVAYVPESRMTQDLYLSNPVPSRTVKLFGVFAIHDLEDGVKRFYFFSILFLAVALILKVAIRFHIQRHTVILHTLFVIGLAGLLLAV